MNAAQAYEWLDPKLSNSEREALDVINARVAELEAENATLRKQRDDALAVIRDMNTAKTAEPPAH